MKKVTVIVVAILAIVLSMLCLTACVKNKDEASSSVEVVGTWKFYSWEVDFEDDYFPIKVGDRFEGRIITEDYIILELKSDGKFSITVDGGNEVGSWRMDGKKGVFTVDNERLGDDNTFDFTIKGDVLTFSIEPECYYNLKKSK